MENHRLQPLDLLDVLLLNLGPLKTEFLDERRDFLLLEDLHLGEHGIAFDAVVIDQLPDIVIGPLFGEVDERLLVLGQEIPVLGLESYERGLVRERLRSDSLFKLFVLGEQLLLAGKGAVGRAFFFEVNDPLLQCQHSPLVGDLSLQPGLSLRL